MNYNGRSQRKQRESSSTNPPKAKYSAAEDFAPECDYYRSDDIEAMRRHLAGKTFTIASLERFEFDDDRPTWTLQTEEFDKPFRVNPSNGRTLAEGFAEDDPYQWVGKQLTIAANNYGNAWGVIMDPVVDVN